MKKPEDGSAPVLYVDADGCPFKEEIIAVAHALRILVVFACAQPHPRLAGREGVEVLDVGDEFQAADERILALLKSGDAVASGDLALARAVLERGAHAIGWRGIFTSHNISEALARRDLAETARALNPNLTTCWRGCCRRSRHHEGAGPKCEDLF